MPTIQEHSESVAKTMQSSGFSFDPSSLTSIITSLLPMLLACFAGQNPASAKDGNAAKLYLTDHYDANSSKYDDSLITSSRHRTRRAARQNGQRHLTNDQLDSITTAAFDKGRTADAADLSSALTDVSPTADS